MVTDLNFLGAFELRDVIALACLLSAWIWIGWRIEHPSPARPSVSKLMAAYRRLWMYEMVTREPRIFDAQVVASMRQGASFFASATMIALGGGLALLGNTDALDALSGDLRLGNAPAIVWEAKIFVLVIMLVNSFLKYVWSHRLFGYCSVMMAAVPNDPHSPLVYARADQAAELSITAARSFNRGLRATYFALACTAWLLGAAALLVATAITVGVLWRREFSSRSRKVLLQDTPTAEFFAREREVRTAARRVE